MMLTATSCPKCHFEFFPLSTLPLPPPPAPRLCVCACACPASAPAPAGGLLSLAVSWTPSPTSAPALGPLVDTLPKARLCPPPLTLNPGKGRKDLMSGGGIIHVQTSMSPTTPLSLAAFSTSPMDIKKAPQPPKAVIRPVQPVAPQPALRISRTLALPDLEFTMLKSTMRTLKLCGWYYQKFSWQDSTALLHQSAEGTFLVRDSSDPRFLFSLSVQTVRGPTSVRLHYVGGGFRLDALPHLAEDMPVFPCVVPLVEHYARKCTHQSDHVLVDAKSQMHSTIRLTVPRRTEPPSLQHLARLAINRSLRPDVSVIDALPLPATVLDYMKEYPYTL